MRKRTSLLFNESENQVALKQEAEQMVVCLTHTDVLLTEERVHIVDICHELAVTKGEISHVSARLGSCQHLQQGWRKRSLDSESLTKSGLIPDT